MNEQVLFELHDGVATITLNRPQKLNAFTPEMLEGLLAAYSECRDNPDVWVAVLTGAGRGFCSGGDTTRMGDSDARTPLESKSDLWGRLQRIPLLLDELDKPVIAAVNGVAAGAGMDLSLMCDFRVASTSARFMESYVKVGLAPGAGGAYFLPRIVGVAKAMELLSTGDMIDADEALRIGLVSYVVAPDELLPRTYEIAGQIAANAPLSVRFIKRALTQGLNIDLRAHLDQVSSHISIARTTEDHVEAIAAMRENRAPAYKGK